MIRLVFINVYYYNYLSVTDLSQAVRGQDLRYMDSSVYCEFLFRFYVDKNAYNKSLMFTEQS